MSRKSQATRLDLFLDSFFFTRQNQNRHSHSSLISTHHSSLVQQQTKKQPNNNTQKNTHIYTSRCKNRLFFLHYTTGSYTGVNLGVLCSAVIYHTLGVQSPGCFLQRAFFILIMRCFLPTSLTMLCFATALPGCAWWSVEQTFELAS